MRRVAQAITAAMAWFLVTSAVAAPPANPGNPAEETGTTGITVLLPLTITEDAILDFGRVIPASTGSTVYAVGIIGGSTIIGVQSGNGTYVDGGHVGHVTVTGSLGHNISFGTSNLGCPGTGVQLTGIAPVLDQGGPLTYETFITGTMKVEPAANGLYNCTYTMTATYD